MQQNWYIHVPRETQGSDQNVRALHFKKSLCPFSEISLSDSKIAFFGLSKFDVLLQTLPIGRQYDRHIILSHIVLILSIEWLEILSALPVPNNFSEVRLESHHREIAVSTHRNSSLTTVRLEYRSIEIGGRVPFEVDVFLDRL